MDNIRDELTRKASEIARDFSSNPSVSLSQRVAEVSKQANLDSTARQLLVGITNKQYMDTTGQTEFPLADPHEVSNFLYESSPSKTASYNYPEYSGELFGDMSYHTKIASAEQAWDPGKDVAKLISGKYNQDYDQAAEEFGALYSKTASLAKNLDEHLDFFHSIGYSASDLVSDLSKKASLSPVGRNVVMTTMSKFANDGLIDPNTRLLYDYEDRFSQVAEVVSDFAKTASQLPAAKERLDLITKNRELLAKVGKVEY